MADKEIKKLDSSLKDDDNEKNSSPTSETPMDDAPTRVKMPVRGELSKLLNDDQNNSASSSETPAEVKMPVKGELSKLLNDDQNNSAGSSETPAEVKMETAVKSELTKLLHDDENKSSSSSETPILDDTWSTLKLQLSEGEKHEILCQMKNKVDANEIPMLKMDDIPAKVKMAAAAKVKMAVAAKSEMPDRLPFKTEYPRYYGLLSATVASESRLNPTLGEPHVFSTADHVESSSEKADHKDDDSSSENESGNVSGG